MIAELSGLADASACVLERLIFCRHVEFEARLFVFFINAMNQAVNVVMPGPFAVDGGGAAQRDTRLLQIINNAVCNVN